MCSIELFVLDILMPLSALFHVKHWVYPEFDFIIHKHHLEKWMNGGLTAENVKKMIKEKGWNNKMLAARWGCSEVWVSKIINDENRKVQWNDAINGLPVISDNMV